MSISHLFNVVVEVYRLKSVSDGAGGYTESYVKDHSEKVRISPAGVLEQTLAAQQELTLSHNAYASPTVDIIRGDQLRVNGTIYQVLGGRNPSKPHHSKWWLEETQVAVAN